MLWFLAEQPLEKMRVFLLSQCMPESVKRYGCCALFRIGFETTFVQQLLVVNQRRLVHSTNLLWEPFEVPQACPLPCVGSGRLSLTPFFNNPRRSISRR